MNKTISIVLAVIACFMLSACDNQQPRPRVDVWGEEGVNDQITDKVCVPFTRTEGNLIEVEVSLNGVPMKMSLDTGASLTCISALELELLAKAGKIELDDYMGEAVTRIANGDQTQEAVFNIKGLCITGNNGQSFVVRDFPAIVSANKSAPLLLGQNVIQELPKYYVDDANSVLVFDKN